MLHVNNPTNFVDPDGLDPSLYDFFSPEDIDGFFDSFRDAYANGYYHCLNDGIAGGWLSPLLGLVAKEGGLHPHNPSNLPERAG